MTTDRQIAANRQNALKSTGPRTPHGKAIASRNNTRHGLRSTTPVIPRLESPAAWQQHRALTIEGLAPANPLEEALAERVALILWRLGRVTAYERDTTARARQQANEDLAIQRAARLRIPDGEAIAHLTQARTRFNQARHWLRALASLSRLPEDASLADRDASAILGAVNEQLPDLEIETIVSPGIVPEDGQDWTVGRLLSYIQVVADAAGRDAEPLLAQTVQATHRRLNEDRAVYDRLARQLQAVRRQRILPKPIPLDHLIRYERHLNRQLTQAIAQLERVQRVRRAATPPPSRVSLIAIDADDLSPAHDACHSNPIYLPDPSESPARSR